ncbi:MAG: PucR family transcriptional regulator ligand-binding domain-containing protein [Lachnospiraceae bacterium]|nr:PucR family transcriptional regulator ligand-binding domain-containing protein [Lachnospiraceae bacterium]
MGFTIEDMLVVSQDRYKMKMEAGSGGWSNSISWLLVLEELTIIQNFTGKELAVTTGLGFQEEETMLRLVEELSAHNSSGLIVNTGFYVKEIPQSVKDFCDANDFPLLTVPWEIILADLIKDLSIRIFVQSSTDEQISGALIHAIEQPEAQDLYTRDLLPHFDLDGIFQIALISTGDLDSMDTVERKRIAYRMHLYLANLTHNGHFFYYASYFVVVMNAIGKEESEEILEAFADRIRVKMTDRKVYIGVSDQVKDIENLHLAYKRARAAVEMAAKRETDLQYFDRMGMYRMLYLIEDRALLRDLSDKPLAPLIEYDREHDGEYVATLESYLRCGGSIKAMSEELYIHRNTILYRMANIKKLLGCSLESPEEKMFYAVACMIRKM